VQRAGAEGADDEGGQDGGQDEVGGELLDDVLLGGGGWVEGGEADEVARGTAEGAHPAGGDEEGEEGDVEEEEGDGEGAGEECLLGHEFPVYSPFVFEGAGELEGAAEVCPGVLAQERKSDEELCIVSSMCRFQYQDI